MKALLSYFVAVVSLFVTSAHAGDFDVLSHTNPILICQRLLTQAGFNPIADDQASINKLRAGIQADRIETEKQAKALAERLTYLKSQLALPDEQRDEQDPRWFLSLREREKNPVTKSLKAGVSQHESVLEMFKRMDEAYKGVETPVARNSSDLGFIFYPVIQEWLHVRLAAVISRVAKTNFATLGANDLATFRWEVNSTLEDVEAFAKTKNSDKADNRLIRDFMKVAEKQLYEFAENWIKENLKDHFTYHGDIAALITLALQHNETLVEVLQKYKKTHEALRRLEYGGYYPGTNVALLSTQLRFDLDTATVVGRYFEILEAGRIKDLEEISLEHNQAQALTVLSFEQKLDAKKITQVFFGIRQLMFEFSKDHADSWRRNYNIGHAGLVVLTRMVIESRMSEQQLKVVLKRFLHFLAEGSKRMEYLGINNLAIALMLEEEKRADGVDLLERYTEIFHTFRREDGGYPRYSDANLARMSTFTVFYKITPAILHQAFKYLEDRKLSTQKVLTIVGLALNDAKVHAQVLKGDLTEFTKAIDTIASIRWLTREREEFAMHDTRGLSLDDIAKKRAESRAAFQRAMGGSDDSDLYGSTRRERDALLMPGLVLDRNGHLHVTMGLGNGLSVDVHSREIRYTSGDFNYSLNGAESGLKGLGVKLF